MTTMPVLGLTELANGQAIPESTVNELGRHLEQGARWFGRVKDRDLATPPGSPADGDCYLVASSGTGAWSGHDGEIAFYMSTAWEFIEPLEGDGAYFADENIAAIYDGAAWTALTTGAAYTDAQARAAVNIAPTTQSGTSYTAVLGDAGGYIQFTNGSPVAFEIPPNGTVAFPIGTVITFEQNGAGVVTLTTAGTTVFNSRGGLLDTGGQYAVVQVKKVATNTWTVIGDVA